jgi:FMN phosphatase YigB (HAD superfamily)
MKNTEDYVITNELMDVNTIILDAYWTLLTPSTLRIRKALEDFSTDKQQELYNLLKRAQDFEDVLEIIPFHSKQKREQFISNIKKDIDTIKPYDESLSILDYLKDKYIIVIDSNLIPPYDKPINENFWSIVDDTILSFQEQYKKWEKEHYKMLKKRFWKNGNEILFIGDNYKNDYEYPKRSWMNALHLQRDGKTHMESVETLEELLNLLKLYK